MKKLPDWAAFIIGQAIVEVKEQKDVKKVREKVLSTAIGVNKKYIAVFDSLIKAKLMRNEK